ncbi:MAG: hypothetical protein IM473_16595 [Microcystis sp. M015S2]|uniref:DNA-binding protein n=1 Tax=unclassified Microcystis TaxID=2643300 RepID=UPI0025848621|nr:MULTISPECIES: DNA-binding protein [unclassified Microcystis]MCA2711453.1 hypothetical protein [Microcystis sp. M025S2]MCA2743963.1 hypothetical protein [Microcystis sp. M015S2]MCA2761183.1 hypothetical protein [Microcystis sp. M145S2]
MARDKLITIRIEREKRDAFNQLAKAQNTDTASLLYDFISGCLSGTLDIKLVTGKGNRLDNQIDTNRLDKLETDTQKIDERVGQISKKLNDWIEAFSDRLNDCDQGLSNKITSLEHRLNALAMQLDSQQDRQQIGSIDTDSQKNDDMEYLLKRERECSIATSPLPPSPPDRPAIETVTPEVSPSPPSPLGTDAIETLPTVETVSTDSSIEPVTDAIETVRGDSDSIDTEPGEAVTIGDKPWYTVKDLLDCHYPGWPETKEGLRKKAKREHWPKRTRRGSKGDPYEYQAVLPD